MDKIVFKINKEGDEFYKKWIKDTKNGIFVATPLMLVFYLTVGLLIWGFELKLIFISIVPTFIILRAFISPYYARKELINQSIKSISIENEIVSIQTFEYFNSPSIYFSFSYKEARLDSVRTHSFFKDKNVWLLTIEPSQEQRFYIVEEFFDDSLEPLKSIFNK